LRERDRRTARRADAKHGHVETLRVRALGGGERAAVRASAMSTIWP
jgi:hypothetical protein